jgi:hypothetical protein
MTSDSLKLWQKTTPDKLLENVSQILLELQIIIIHKYIVDE